MQASGNAGRGVVGQNLPFVSHCTGAQSPHNASGWARRRLVLCPLFQRPSIRSYTGEERKQQMQVTLNKVIPPVSPDKWRFQLVVVQSLPKSVYLDRERFTESLE